MRVVAEDLWFPEGPVWLPDGSIVLVEIRRGTLTRVWPDGRKSIVANLGGGPNGAALGPDGAMVREVIFPMWKPNGIGLSPDGRTLYVAETETARLWAWDVTAPGVVAAATDVAVKAAHGGRLIYAPHTYARFDSLAVEANGFICVATLGLGGISVCAPDASGAEFIATGDDFTTNICFGGADMKTAWLTLSGSGRLAQMDWPRAGLKLNAC